ncbi:MAG TPA: hypothetical protein VGQ27_07985 [Steroidobacteraceae bacterium]|jgi:hypothetical protein|nr:hypothetical protein [Steroidobacteraceae bacterium]
MDARHPHARWVRLALALMAAWLALGLWQAYGSWLLAEVRSHVA